MRILSKYKDFYDSCGAYDESIPVYDRTTQYFTKNNVPAEFLQEFVKVFSKYDNRYTKYTKWLVQFRRPPRKIYVGIYPRVWIIDYKTVKVKHYIGYDETQYLIDFEKPVQVEEDCYDLFKVLNAPVFVYSHEENCLYDKKKMNYTLPQYCSLIVNPVIQHVVPCPARYVNTDPLRVYNNIENFLWSQRETPVSEPDNITKIESHGFDKKTSFRNIK